MLLPGQHSLAARGALGRHAYRFKFSSIMSILRGLLRSLREDVDGSGVPESRWHYKHQPKSANCRKQVRYMHCDSNFANKRGIGRLTILTSAVPCK